MPARTRNEKEGSKVRLFRCLVANLPIDVIDTRTGNSDEISNSRMPKSLDLL